MMIGSEDTGGSSGLSDGEVRDEALTLLLAGHETTANALMWTWYLLSDAPEAGARLHEEVDRVLAGRQRLGRRRRIAALRVERRDRVDAAVPAGVDDRPAGQGGHQIGGYPVPAGGMVFMSQWTMHHDARF